MKCSCYHEKQEIKHAYESKTGKRLFSYEVPVGSCWGTRERDACGCGGDTKKCDFYPEKRIEKCDAAPLTNANKIRSMSDEELAEFLLNAHANFCTAMETDCIYGWHGGDCKKHALEWLKEPAEEGK